MMDALDMDIGSLASNAASIFGGIPVVGAGPGGDSFSSRCSRCSFGGCDVRVHGCGCNLHARCVVLTEQTPIQSCPNCARPTSGLVLLPMSFHEIDEAKKSAATLPAAPKGRGRKRKGSVDNSDESGLYISEKRTGRWSNEETAFCDKLITKFESGELPIADSLKLNEFLGNMLKSKQSRLTKKMKNARLSSKSFQRTVGGLVDVHEAREMSELEDSFLNSIQDPQERAEMRFHMQREWRDQFTQYCLALNQTLDAEDWLNSVEEMDRRASQAKDAARMAKRKLMMGFALRTDSLNPDNGVFIEKSASDQRIAKETLSLEDDESVDHRDILQLLADESKDHVHADMNGKSSMLHSAPFLGKAVSYLQRHGVPFEHIDLWVPSFVPGDGQVNGSNCRLCYAGSATVSETVDEDLKTRKALSQEEQFNLYAFGDYSQKFSFQVGCGLPGRVYETGHPTWEQSVHNAPHHHFERCGGALQWGIKTVVGIPIASPNVGRIVVVLYSCADRMKDQDLVGRLSDEFTRLMPSPKWKLVVDVGHSEPVTSSGAAVEQSVENNSNTQVSGELSDNGSVGDKDPRSDEVIALLGELMPSDPNSTFGPYLSGFMSLRLLLLRPSRTQDEEELARTMLDSYTSYTQGGRSRGDIGIMLARDFMFLSQQKNQQQEQQPAGFFSVGQSIADDVAPSALSEYSAFNIDLPDHDDVDLPSSPTLAPIPVPGNDTVSIVSN